MDEDVTDLPLRDRMWSSRATSRASTSTPSSTPPTARCSAAAAWTAPSTAPPGPGCWRSAARWAAARRARRGSPAATACRRGTSSTRSGPVWHGGDAASPSCCARATAVAARWPRGRARDRSPSRAISTGVYGYPKARGLRHRRARRRATGCAPHELPRAVIFCCFGAGAAELYRRRLAPASDIPYPPWEMYTGHRAAMS